MEYESNRDGDTLYTIARKNKKEVGKAVVRLLGANCFKLDGIFVEEQGRGIGTHLKHLQHKELLKRAKNNNWDSVEIIGRIIQDNNVSIKFHRKLGYTVEFNYGTDEFDVFLDLK